MVPDFQSVNVPNPAGPAGSERHRAYCFDIRGTRNVPLPLLDAKTWPQCSFLVYQKEIHTLGGLKTECFVGYLELTVPLAMDTIKKWPGFYQTSCHLMKLIGSQAQAIRYSVKPDIFDGGYVPDDSRVQGPWWYGFRKHQGARTDLIPRKPQEQPDKIPPVVVGPSKIPPIVVTRDDKEYVPTDSSSSEDEQQTVPTTKRLRRPPEYLEKYAAKLETILEEPEMTTYRKRRILKYVFNKTY